MTSDSKGYLIPVERVDNAILEIRGQKVMLDADLATLYGVTTKALNQAVKRNRDRFPEGFVFELTLEEKDELVTNCDRYTRLKHSSTTPWAFTEHGAVMLAALLKSKRAVEVSVFVVRAFVRMRRLLAEHRQLALKLSELEMHVSRHDKTIQAIVAALRKLAQPDAPARKPIGFRSSQEDR